MVSVKKKITKYTYFCLPLEWPIDPVTAMDQPEHVTKFF